jgi:hypothetical protein
MKNQIQIQKKENLPIPKKLKRKHPKKKKNKFNYCFKLSTSQSKPSIIPFPDNAQQPYIYYI